ncbi:MAG: response regulator transcription factor [Anaeroplasmataceae bacterium]|nr:response regulator transcription factor [Anaeroplasmataceae bacterium]
MKFNCLIIDDEKILADSTAEYFNLFGVATHVAYSVLDCYKFFKEHTTDLILLDINLEDGSGFDLCKDIRQSKDIPILFVSARTSDDDKIIALNIGGDDYIQKPYSLGVLLAKVKVVLKRYGGLGNIEYVDDNLHINFEAKQVKVNGNKIKLTMLEFKLLSYLVEHKGKVISKKELFEKVWEDKFVGDGTLNVHIRRLREAIENDPNNPKYIVTVWGDGYKFLGGNE